MRQGLIILVLLCLLGIGTSGVGTVSRTLQQERRHVVLWAWERPEDLSFVDSRTTGIAFLAGTVRITATGAVRIEPRHQPLKISDHASPIAVIRIETDRTSHPNKLSPRASSDVVAAICHLTDSYKISEVQIDFDARVSERVFYRDLLNKLRKRLPSTKTITITALASWCIHDTWMNELPVQEAVPMLFRMGPERGQILRFLERNNEFREPLCRSSVGISTDEPLIKISSKKRLYIFSPTKWTKKQVQQVLQEVN